MTSPDLERKERTWPPAPSCVADGLRPDYSWIRLPGAFDELGSPIQVDGASGEARGLFFVGVHFLRKRKSSLLFGVGEDASIVARKIAHRV